MLRSTRTHEDGLGLAALVQDELKLQEGAADLAQPVGATGD